MPLAKLPVTGLDDINHRRRSRETLNQVLDHTFDDSRVTTAAEKLADVTIINAAFAPGDVRRYGAKIDGVTDDSGPLFKAIKQASIDGSEVLLPEGDIALSSAVLGTAGIVGGSKISITGRGKNNTRIVVIGTSICNILVFTNQSDLKFVDVTFRGNSESSGPGEGMPVWIIQNNSATEAGHNYQFIRCRFENFKADYWLWFLNTGTTYSMHDIRIVDCDFISESGNCRDGTSLGVPSDMVAFQGSSASTAGLVTDAHVKGCNVNGEFVKNFVVCWQGSRRIKCTGNIIKDIGKTGIDSDTAAYVFLVYDNSGGAGGLPPGIIDISDNIMDGCLSCGVYCAGIGPITISGNTIRGQTDTDDSLLPKGAICINESTYGVVENNTIENCFFGIQLFSSRGVTSRLIARNNSIIDCPTNGFGVVVGTASSVAAGKGDTVVIDGLTISNPAGSCRGLQFRFSSTRGLQNLVVRNFKIAADYSCIELSSFDATVPDLQSVHISNGELGGANNYGLFWSNAQDSETNAVFESLVFKGTWGATAFMALFDSSYGLTLKNLTFCNMTTGTGKAYSASASRGRVAGIQYSNVTSAYRFLTTGSEDLAIDPPTWTGATQDFVQQLNLTELGVAASKYFVSGYMWDDANAVWLQSRMLTGN